MGRIRLCTSPAKHGGAQLLTRRLLLPSIMFSVPFSFAAIQPFRHVLFRESYIVCQSQQFTATPLEEENSLPVPAAARFWPMCARHTTYFDCCVCLCFIFFLLLVPVSFLSLGRVPRRLCFDIPFWWS